MPRHFYFALAGLFLALGANSAFGLFAHPTPMEFVLRTTTVGGSLIGLFVVAVVWRQYARKSRRSAGKPG